MNIADELRSMAVAYSLLGEKDLPDLLTRAADALTVPAWAEGDQDWAGISGAVAFHLIDRHAENWAHVGELMEAFAASRGKGEDDGRG